MRVSRGNVFPVGALTTRSDPRVHQGVLSDPWDHSLSRNTLIYETCCRIPQMSLAEVLLLIFIRYFCEDLPSAEQSFTSLPLRSRSSRLVQVRLGPESEVSERGVFKKSSWRACRGIALVIQLSLEELEEQLPLLLLSAALMAACCSANRSETSSLLAFSLSILLLPLLLSLSPSVWGERSTESHIYLFFCSG